MPVSSLSSLDQQGRSPGEPDEVLAKDTGLGGELASRHSAPRLCGGWLRVIAIVQNPAVVRTLLATTDARAPAAPGPAPPGAPIG